MSTITTVEVVRPTDALRLALQNPLTLLTPKQLFDFEVEELVTKGFAAYDHADSFYKRLPSTGVHVLVPPKPRPWNRAHLNYLVSLIEVDGEKGRNYTDPAHFSDEDEVSDGPHLMLDVDDTHYLNVKPSVSRATILAEGRHPFCTWRGIICALLFPWRLRGRGWYLAGSGGRFGQLPCVRLFNGTPILNAWYGNALREFVTPSCGSIWLP